MGLLIHCGGVVCHDEFDPQSIWSVMCLPILSWSERKSLSEVLLERIEKGREDKKKELIQNTIRMVVEQCDALYGRLTQSGRFSQG